MGSIIICYYRLIYLDLRYHLVFVEIIQGVPEGKDLTTGECSLGQTVPI